MADNVEKASEDVPPTDPARLETESQVDEITEVPQKSKLDGTTANQLQDEMFYLKPIIEKAVNFDINNASQEDIIANNNQLRYVIGKVTEALLEKSGLYINSQNKTKTLKLKVSSLKDLVDVTKDLLRVRNTEVEQLYACFRNMEENNLMERSKYHSIAVNMGQAVEVITKLKDDYKSHVDFFSNLQEGYEKNIDLLAAENKRLSKIHEDLSLAKEKNDNGKGASQQGKGKGDTELPEECTSSV